LVVHRFGGPEVLQLVEEELPSPQPGQARIKVLAADVSFSDVNVRRGRYPGGPRPPFTPGYAIVGVVDALATATTGPPAGQLVAALTFYGGYSQYICIGVEALVPIRKAVDPAEAVSLVLGYVAAYQMLIRVARAPAGSQILVHGAAGGVGTAFLELARVFGLRAIGTASKPKHRLVEQLGATPIDYKNEDFVARTLAITKGVGVDAAFDPMGASHLRQTEGAVRNGGTLVAYGFYETSNRGANIVLDVLSQYLRLALWSLPPRRKHVAFYDIRPLQKRHPDWFQDDLSTLVDLLSAGKLHPVIAERLPLEGAVRAHQLLEHAEVQGKFVLVPHAQA
jgi:NADPH:quinone reductase-like Zn-dependent oxidoreductase